MRLSFLLLLCLPLACLPTPAIAQTAIHHCVAPDGTPVFTDQPCASMGATKASTAPTNPFAPGPPTPPRACPKTLDALKKRVAEAFGAHNANALAGLMLWHGYGERGAVHTMRDLADLMQWSFLGFADDPMTDTLSIKLDRPDQPGASFAITSQAGCLWLQP